MAWLPHGRRLLLAWAGILVTIACGRDHPASSGMIDAISLAQAPLADGGESGAHEADSEDDEADLAEVVVLNSAVGLQHLVAAGA